MLCAHLHGFMPCTVRFLIPLLCATSFPQPALLSAQPASHGATFPFPLSLPRFSPTVFAYSLHQNDPAMSQLVADVGAQLAAADGGVQVAADIEPCMAAEDFAFYGRQVPSAFTFLGIADEAKGTTTGLHNPRFLMVGTRPPQDGGGAGGRRTVVGPWARGAQRVVCLMVDGDLSTFGQDWLGRTGGPKLPSSEAAVGIKVSPSLAQDEDQLPLGAALHAAVALEYLQRRADGAKAGEVAGATAAAAAAGGTAPAPAGTRDEL